MSLEELQRSVRVHLGRYYAQQVVLQPYPVHRPYPVPLHYEAQAPGETAGNLLLPVESYAYGHVVQDEGRLAEEGGARHRVEGELVVEGAVVVDLPVRPTHALGAGSVGDDLEDYLPCGHYAYVDLGLGAGEAPYHERIVLLAHGHLVHHLPELFLGDLPEILLPGDDEVSRHVGGAGAHREMLLPFREVVMGAQVGAQDHSGAELAVLVPGIEVEAGFALPFPARRAFQQAVEELGHRLLGSGLEDVYPAGEAFELVESGVLHAFELAGGAVQGLVRCQFEGQDLPRAGLEMQMVRGGRAAHRAVVEHREVLIHLRKEQHVRKVMPDGLGKMLVAGDDQMVAEDGIGVHLHIVAAVFLALVLYVELFLWAVRRAEETGPRGDGLFVHFGRGGDNAAGVHLKGHLKSSHIHVSVFRILQGTEIRGRKRPYRQLVLYEFVYVRHIITRKRVCLQSFCTPVRTGG